MLGLFAKTFFLLQNKRTLCNKFSQRIIAVFGLCGSCSIRDNIVFMYERNMINHAPSAGACRLIGICQDIIFRISEWQGVSRKGVIHHVPPLKQELYNT